MLPADVCTEVQPSPDSSGYPAEGVRIAVVAE